MVCWLSHLATTECRKTMQCNSLIPSCVAGTVHVVDQTMHQQEKLECFHWWQTPDRAATACPPKNTTVRHTCHSGFTHTDTHTSKAFTCFSYLEYNNYEFYVPCIIPCTLRRLGLRIQMKTFKNNCSDMISSFCPPSI